jgi:sphingomyelin phosphodiesterase acid-like 3
MHIWSTWVTDKNNQYSFQTLFPTAGYYSVDPEESQNQRIIVLNSILFAKAVKGTQTKEAALSELNWLHAQLTQAAAKHTKVIIALHIPPIMQVYGFDVKDFWQSSYSDMFNKDLKTFSTTISAVIAGHLHYDHFEWTTYQNSSVPISVTPAVSPAFGSDPAFKIYHYDPNTFTLKSIDGYFYPLKNKGEPNVIWQKKISNNYAGD